MYSLKIVAESGVELERQFTLDSRCQIGRAVVNDIVLADPAISAFHAVFWFEGGQLRVRDLGSRNGTFVNGSRVRGATGLAAEDEVVLGTSTAVRIGELSEADEPMILLRCEETGMVWVVEEPGIALGGSASCEVELPGSEVVATVAIHGGAATLLADGASRALAIDEVFEVQGRCFRLLEGPLDEETLAAPLESATHPYRLVLRAAGAFGPEVEVWDGGGERAARFQGCNRAVLLYALGSAWLEDEQRPVPARGWRSTDELLTAVWGRRAVNPNKLHVLIFRVRSGLEKEGLPTEVFERRNGSTRLLIRDVAWSEPA